MRRHQLQLNSFREQFEMIYIHFFIVVVVVVVSALDVAIVIFPFLPGCNQFSF